MTEKEAIAQLKLDRALCNFNPMTGEEEPMNEDCRKLSEALDLAIKSLRQVEKLRKLMNITAEKEQVYANESNDTTMYFVGLANAYCTVTALIDEILGGKEE